MKRIGILTFHRSINYGAFMQSYALSLEISKRYTGNNIEIIDFEYLFKHKHYKKNSYIFPVFVENIFRYNAFQKDLKQLPLSPESFITNNEDVLIEYIKKRYDIVIVGSDAVWAFQKMKLNNPYWLFGDKLRDVIKMSFAASAYSTDFEKITTEDRSFIYGNIKDFQYIGVRDAETFNFISSLCPDGKIYLNNDPTFFLDKPDNYQYANKIFRKNLVYTKKPVASFMTRNLPHIDEVKKYLSNKFTFIHFYHRNRLKDFIDNQTRFLFNLSPIEWYNIYCKSTINFSQYFHGTLLGIINSVPTFSIDDTEFTYKYIGKNEQVMTDLKLNDYLFYTKTLKTSKEEKDRLLAQIDYALSNIENERIRLKKAANEERKKSESFFKALSTYL